ncbi:MAG: hypothetical protein ACOYM9_22705 [Bradymonadia bacterium]|jgi:hypothetical protein
MKLLTGVFKLTFQSQTCECPIAGVRDGDGHVEVAIGTPFGLRRVHARLGPDLRLVEAHTFAFNYETGQVTRFELEIEGGFAPDRPRTFEGSVRGPGLTGQWTVTDLSGGRDETDEAESAFTAFARPKT